MEIIYIADDGTEFDDLYECETYEECKKHPHLYDIIFLDSAGEELDHSKFKYGIFDDSLYQKCESIVVHNDDEVTDLLWSAEYCGWCEFEQITSPGTWIREEGEVIRNGVWSKEE